MASIKKCLEQFTGQEQAREEAKKQAASLVQLANAKLNELEMQMKEMFRNKELEAQVQIVGDRMGAFSREYRVNYSDGDISSAVDELVGQIMDIGSEKATAIISKAIKNGLHAMFSSVSVSEENKRMFVVLLEGAAMVRYDIWIWKSSQQDQALFSHVESVVAITYARSVVDHTKLSEDELNDGIYRSLGGVSLQEIIAYKKELLELFKLTINPAVRSAPGMLGAEPDASLSPEETSRELGCNLLEMLQATGSPVTRAMPGHMNAPDPAIQELLSMETGKYHLM